MELSNNFVSLSKPKNQKHENQKRRWGGIP